MRFEDIVSSVVVEMLLSFQALLPERPCAGTGVATLAYIFLEPYELNCRAAI